MLSIYINKGYIVLSLLLCLCVCSCKQEKTIEKNFAVSQKLQPSLKTLQEIIKFGKHIYNDRLSSIA